jgi:anti-anti-sigma regulatory factor
MESRDTAPLLRLGGPLTVSTADATKATLMRALDGESFVIDCSGATEIDLSFVQLVIAARRAAELRGKTIRLAAPASGTLRDVLERTGLLDAATGPVTPEAAFWTKGNVA